VSRPTIPLPSSKSRDDGQDERSVLLRYLDYHRAVLVRKLDGVSDGDARRPACPPSPLNLLGLLRHMTDVERDWFRNTLVGEGIGYRYTESPDDERDLFPPDDATVADAVAGFVEEIAIVDAILARASLDDMAVAAEHPSSLRRIIVHLIEEYARHCGHADLLREAVDGTTGD
jgi:hypothetical protein